ncbi:MAG TPA: hypothetical protein VK698_29630 [Kofleriaceae bacterium]|nr:hypothetical protein [Kofleriaceae bacterium]
MRSLAVCLALGALAGCGSLLYIDRVTRTASADVEAARAARAEVLAPYWYTLAVEYLGKAREEAGEADFQAANRLGQKASEAARRALAVARARGRGKARASGARNPAGGEGAR